MVSKKRMWNKLVKERVEGSNRC